MANGREPDGDPSIKKVKAPSSPETKKEPKKLLRRGFLKSAGAALAALAFAETGLGAFLAACADAPPDRHSYRHIPDKLTDPDARMYWERFEFRVDTRKNQITIKLTDAGRRAMDGTQDPQTGKWIQWPNLNDFYNAASIHADQDEFAVDYDRFAEGLIKKYGPDPQHPERETILMQKGTGYVLNPKAGEAIFELPGDCFVKKEQPTAVTPSFFETPESSRLATASPDGVRRDNTPMDDESQPSISEAGKRFLDFIPWPFKAGGAIASGFTGWRLLKLIERIGSRPTTSQVADQPAEKPSLKNKRLQQVVAPADYEGSADDVSSSAVSRPMASPDNVIRASDRLEAALASARQPLRVISTFVSPDGAKTHTVEEGRLRKETVKAVRRLYPDAVISTDSTGKNVITIPAPSGTKPGESYVVEGPSWTAGKVPPPEDHFDLDTQQIQERAKNIGIIASSFQLPSEKGGPPPVSVLDEATVVAMENLDPKKLDYLLEFNKYLVSKGAPDSIGEAMSTLRQANKAFPDAEKYNQELAREANKWLTDRGYEEGPWWYDGKQEGRFPTKEEWENSQRNPKT